MSPVPLCWLRMAHHFPRRSLLRPQGPSTERHDPIIRVAESAGDLLQPIDVANVELIDIEARENNNEDAGVNSYCVIA
ncbi:hypothetical protein DFH09DRAFT_1320260 [Mycena vulgaris]|nr:hypothetical protein DFH09DRAFT_1320260 [Mycena vulgaris]